MSVPTVGSFTVFADQQRVATGSLPEMAVQAHQALLDRPDASVLVFDDTTGRVIDVDLRGTPEQVRERAEEPELAPEPEATENPMAARRPGRPKLGVVSREVTLLPRHWDWLSQQEGGISVTLRKLVEAARKNDPQGGAARQARDAAYRFMLTLAGNEPGFEEASRALFAGDAQGFARCIANWPPDVRAHSLHLAGRHTPESAQA